MKRALSLVSGDSLDRALAVETDAAVAGFLDPAATRRLTAF
jgi:hypothetical protein